MINYSLSALKVEIMTGNLWAEDDPPTTEWWAETGWVNILGRLKSIAIEHACQYDTLNFAPQAGSARISISVPHGIDFFARLHARPIRVRYRGVTLFKGTVLETNSDVSPDTATAQRYDIDLTCAASMYDLAKVQLNKFKAPVQSGAARLARINAATGKLVTHYGLTTYQCGPIVEPYSGDALSLLSELALSHHARFYCTANNTLVMTDVPPSVVVAFDVIGGADFTSASFSSSDDQHLSGSLAILKRNEDITHYRSTTAPYTTRDEEFLVDVRNRAQLTDWNQAIRLRNFPAITCRALRTLAIEDIDWSLVHLTELATIRLPGRGPNQVGITSIAHDITPTKWAVDFEFCQRFFVNDPTDPPP